MTRKEGSRPGFTITMMDYDADPRMRARGSRLRRHWRWLLAATGLCAFAALVTSLFLPKVYRATTYLLVSESKIGASSQITAWQYATLATYVPFVDNDSLIQAAIEKFGLDRPPFKLTVDRFRRKDYLDVRTLKSTRLVELNVEFPDAQLAAGLANFLAKSAVEFNDRMNAEDTVATQRLLQQRLDEAEEHLTQATRHRLEVRRRARIEDREKELNILLAEKEHLAAQVRTLRRTLTESESKAGALEESLRAEPRTFHLTKSVTSDRFVERAVERAGDDSVVPLAVTEESLNLTREDLRRSFVNYRVTSAGARAALEAATERLGQVNAQIHRLLDEVTRTRSEIEQADRDYSLARETLESASRDYRNALVTVSSKSQDLKNSLPRWFRRGRCAPGSC